MDFFKSCSYTLEYVIMFLLQSLVKEVIFDQSVHTYYHVRDVGTGGGQGARAPQILTI